MLSGFEAQADNTLATIIDEIFFFKIVSPVYEAQP